ncbi:MAG TPA: FAD:protein FMN transferase [Thermodesulfovibrionales bacterium]|nr:FAD:protein FMN transferase [Thermodesulfovibrionales bacterium]
MDTLVTITIVTDSADRAEKAMDKAFAEIGKLDTLLNFFSEKSELSMVNKNAGLSEVKVSPETMEVVEKAIETSEKTGGAFDVTIGPEISQWNFVLKIKPQDESIKRRLRLVNYKLIQLDKGRSTVHLKEKGMLMDLGGIAKGYAADKAVDELKKIGITSGLVAVAGEVKAFGRKPGGKGWTVGIRNPRSTEKSDEIMATVQLNDAAISTSGDYQRYFILDGKRFHHILDPETGYPAQGCQSVSVIARDGVYTDAFSTGVFVLGPKKGIELLQSMGFEGLIVDKDGTIYTTPGLKGKIEFTTNH